MCIRDSLKSLQTKSLPPALIHTLLSQDTSNHHVSTLLGLLFTWVKSGCSLIKPSLQKSSLPADTTYVASHYVQLHLPSAELHGMDSFPVPFMRRGDKQERLLARKPEPWVLLSCFLPALHSDSVVVALVLFCGYSFCREDLQKRMIS